MFVAMTATEFRRLNLPALSALYGNDEALAMIKILLDFCVVRENTYLRISDQDLSRKEETSLNEAINKLLSHIPLQYITGEAWFYNLKLFVNNHVLIPRPETEELVQHAISFLKNSASKRVLDVGTGSGCIPVAIKYNLPHAAVTAIDVSEDALAVALKNATNYNCGINFINLDFLNEDAHVSLHEYDLIISNPPYIPASAKDMIDSNVKDHEPHIALFVSNEDPLIFYKKIAAFADKHLTEKGKIMVEIHYDLAEQTASVFNNKNFNTEILKDMSGNDRMLIISRCP